MVHHAGQSDAGVTKTIDVFGNVTENNDLSSSKVNKSTISRKISKSKGNQSKKLKSINSSKIATAANKLVFQQVSRSLF